MHKLLARERITACEDRAEVNRVDLAGKSDLSGKRAHPSASALAPTRVVVLGRRGHLADVVLDRTRREKSDVQHTDLSAPSNSLAVADWRAERTGVTVSSDQSQAG